MYLSLSLSLSIYIYIYIHIVIVPLGLFAGMLFFKDAGTIVTAVVFVLNLNTLVPRILESRFRTTGCAGAAGVSAGGIRIELTSKKQTTSIYAMLRKYDVVHTTFGPVSILLCVDRPPAALRSPRGGLCSKNEGTPRKFNPGKFLWGGNLGGEIGCEVNYHKLKGNIPKRGSLNPRIVADLKLQRPFKSS